MLAVIMRNSQSKFPQIFSFLFFLLFFAILVAYFGEWRGWVWVSQQGGSKAVFLAGLTFFAVIVAVIGKRFLRFHLPYPKLFIAFLLNIFVMSFLRDDVLLSLWQSAGVFFTVLIVFFMASLLYTMSFVDALLTLCIAVLATLLASTYVHITKVGLLTLFDHSYTSRLGGLFYYAHFAMLAGFGGLISVLGLFYSHSFRYKVVFVITLLVSSILLPFTDTRSVLFSFVVCAVVAYFYINRKITIYGILFLFFSLAISALAFIYFNYSSTGVLQETDVNMRYQIWLAALQAIANKPLQGYGNTDYFYSFIWSRGVSPNAIRDPHSSFLAHALQYGLTSLVLFMAYYAAFFIRAYKFSRKYRALVSIALYWIIAPLAWGIYGISGGFIEMFFLLSFVGVLGHPDLE